MKLKHLIQSIHVDIIDAQKKSYQYSEQLLKEQPGSLFPVPFTKGTEVELTLQFALKNAEGLKKEWSTNKNVALKSLKCKLKKWMNEVLISYQIPENIINQETIEQEVLEMVNQSCVTFRSKWDSLVDEHLTINKAQVVNLFQKKYTVFLEKNFFKHMILTTDQQDQMLTEFAKYVEDKIADIKTIIEKNSSVKNNLMADFIVDAEQLKELPPQSIHTAKLNFRIDDLNQDDYE